MDDPDQLLLHHRRGNGEGRDATIAIAALEAAVAAALPAFREKWWHYQNGNPASRARGACCLNNRTIRGRGILSATYDRLTSKTTVALADGTFYYWP